MKLLGVRASAPRSCQHHIHALQRRCISDARPFQVDDVVLLRNKRDRDAPAILTRPLRAGKRIETHRGIIQHDDIIGKRVRDVVEARTSKANKAPTGYRIHEVSLEHYCRLTARLVTPIYPADANLIVSLLDLHPGDYDTEGESKLEILEAGTGHGALTLHFSRAIHAANPRGGHPVSGGDRRAVIHTIDVSPRFSEHAKAIVNGFRHGMYASNVDFHVGDVSDWVKKTLPARDSRPFLSHAFLDLPSSDTHIATVAEALRTDGTLIVFNPSITQINECATRIKDENIQLDLEKVVELGVNGGSGGREWDVKFVHPRAASKVETQATASDSAGDKDGEVDSDLEQRLPDATPGQKKWLMVCRPKVGDRISGGGFLGVWKKQRDIRTNEDMSGGGMESTEPSEQLQLSD